MSVTPVPPARRSRGAWILGGLAAAALLGAVIAPRLIAAGDAAPPTAAPAASAPAPVSGADDTSLALRVVVTTPGAVATLDGARVDLPFAARFARDGRGHTLRVEAPGYATYSEVVVFDRDRELTLALEPATTVAASATVPAPAVAPAGTGPRPRVPAPRPTPTGKPLVDDRDPWGASRPR